jgi:hypothetical protein
MSSIIKNGDTFSTGLSSRVFGLGVFVRRYGYDIGYEDRTYAGQHKDGYACGLGKTTVSYYRSCDIGSTEEYAEHGPDGNFDGRCFLHSAGIHNLDTSTGAYTSESDNNAYSLYERGERKAHAVVNGGYNNKHLCTYNGEACALDDPRLLALIAQVKPVQVRPAAPSPPRAVPSLVAPSNRPMCRLVLPPQALADAVATEVHPHARTPVPGGRATQPTNSRNATHLTTP